MREELRVRMDAETLVDEEEWEKVGGGDRRRREKGRRWYEREGSW